MVEDLHHLTGEAAHRELRGSLHEQHHVVGLHFIVDELLDGHGDLIPYRRGARPLPARVPPSFANICSARGCANPSAAPPTPPGPPSARPVRAGRRPSGPAAPCRRVDAAAPATCP